MFSERVLNSWKIAAKDLNINIRSPFSLTTKDNRKIKFDLFVENFGSPNGIVILTINDMHDLSALKDFDISFSALSKSSYSTYNRQHFIDTLNDWGYFGDRSKTPEWYTGQPWTD